MVSVLNWFENDTVGLENTLFHSIYIPLGTPRDRMYRVMLSTCSQVPRRRRDTSDFNELPLPFATTSVDRRHILVRLLLDFDLIFILLCPIGSINKDRCKLLHH